jgi:indole-3-acetate monooxygenase
VREVAAAALACVDAIGPLIVADARRAEDTGQLTPEVLAALHSTGLFRMLVPQELGGWDLTLPECVPVFRRVASYDASTGWLLAILADGALFARLIAPASLAEVCTEGSLLAGSLNPLAATARPVEGGYLLSGQAPYASGCLHATWLMVAARVLADPDASYTEGRPPLIAGIVPMDRATIQHTWSTSGMRATGSHDCLVDNVFVPDDRVFSWTSPEARFVDHWAHIPLRIQLGSAISATVVGAARGTLQSFIALANTKVPLASAVALADRPHAQFAMGRAEGLVLAAEDTLDAATRDLWDQAATEHPFTVTDQARLRARAVTATRLSCEAIDLLHDVTGMSGIVRGSPLERAWRDAHTASQHFNLDVSRLEVTGRIALGRDPGSPVI